MTGVLEAAVALLAVVVSLLVVLIIVIRVVIRRQHGRERKLRPRAELGIADYLTEPACVPTADGAGERAVLLAVALEALGDLRGGERAHLADLVEQLGYVDEAIAGLGARRRALRRQSAATLEAVAPASAVYALAAGLDDRDAIVRAACARTLANLDGEDAAIAAIVAVAKRDVHIAPGAVAAVVVTLGTARPSALAPLLSGDAAWQVRLVAVEVVGRLRLAQHATLLRGCLRDRDEVAAAAASGLGMIGDNRSVGALMDLAHDDRRAPYARIAATAALGSIGEASAVPLLESQLGDGDWALAAAAIQALSWLGDPGGAALHRAASSSRPEVRAMAEAALEQ